VRLDGGARLNLLAARINATGAEARASGDKDLAGYGAALEQNLARLIEVTDALAATEDPNSLLKTSAISNSSLMLATRRMPQTTNAASKTSSDPVIEPVCEAAALRAASVRPGLITMIGCAATLRVPREKAACITN